MPLPLQKLRPSSINLDVPAFEVPPEEWTGGLNFVFRDGFANRVLGWDAIFPETSDVPVHLFNARQTNEHNYWLSMQPDGIFVSDGGDAWVDITPASYVHNPTANDWTSCLLNGLPVINNGNMPPFYWDLDEGNVCQTLPGWDADTRCGAIRSYKYHLIAMDITDTLTPYPDQIFWSNAASAGNIPSGSDAWTPTPSGDAGDNILSATRGAVLDGAKLRGQFIIYKDHSAYQLAYSGGTFVFTLTKFLSNVGLLSRNCVAEVDGYHAIFSDGDIMRTDGQSVTSIISRRMKQTVFNEIDPSNYRACYVVLNRSRSEVLFCYPQAGVSTPNRAVVWDYARDKLSIRDIGESPYMAVGTAAVQDLANPWNDATTTWNDTPGEWGASLYQTADDGILMLQDGETQIYRLDGSDTEGGVDVTANISRDFLDFDSPGTVKTVTRIWPRISSDNDALVVQVRVGGSKSPDEPPVFCDWKSHTPATEDYLTLFATGRYISVQFAVWGDDSFPFQLEGFDLEFSSRGRY